MLFLQIKGVKSRHPVGVVGSLAGTHRPPGERPVCLLGLRLAARASALFCLIRPERANRQNSPARASGKAGPPRFAVLHNASLRSFLPFSAVQHPNQGGPVSPDARAGSRLRMLRTLPTPWTGFGRADRKNLAWGPFFLTPRVGARGVCPSAVYRNPHRFALQVAIGQQLCAADRSSQQLLAADRGKRQPSATAQGKQQLLAAAFNAVPGRFSPVARITIAQPSAGSACTLPAQSLVCSTGRPRQTSIAIVQPSADSARFVWRGLNPSNAPDLPQHGLCLAVSVGSTDGFPVLKLTLFKRLARSRFRGPVSGARCLSVEGA